MLYQTLSPSSPASLPVAVTDANDIEIPSLGNVIMEQANSLIIGGDTNVISSSSSTIAATTTTTANNNNNNGPKATTENAADATNKMEIINPTSPPFSSAITVATNTLLVRAETLTLDGKNDRSLENDNCPETTKKVLNFLDLYKSNLKCYNYQRNKINTVLLCRTTTAENSLYYWNVENKLTVNMLEQHFGTIGHTLGIDYTRSYVRKFALDIDCICRINPSMGHVGEELINAIHHHLMNVLKTTLELHKNPITTIWKNKCGFHIYSDINVSMPTHLYLCALIGCKFNNTPAKIEVPNIMPLPYSAKIPSVPYKPLLVYSISIKNVNLAMHSEKYYELFQFNSYRCNNNNNTNNKNKKDTSSSSCEMKHKHSSTAFLTIITEDSEIYLNKLNAPSLICTIPYVPKVKSILTHDSAFEQVVSYIRIINEDILHMQKYLNNAVSDSYCISPSMENLDDKNILLRDFFTQFFVLFKQGGDISNEQLLLDDDYDAAAAVHPVNTETLPDIFNLFVRMASESYGGLYIQPFVVALDKKLKLKDSETFRNILREIFSEKLATDTVLSTFINNYHFLISQSYTDSCTDILKILQLIFVRDLKPEYKIRKRMDILMESALNRNAEENLNLMNTAPKTDRGRIFFETMNVLIQNLILMRAVYFCNDIHMWYVLNNDGYYTRIAANELKNSIPCDLGRWITHSKLNTAIELIKQSNNDFATNQNCFFTNSKYLLCTSVGIFNSITGLYTAHTPFLRFDKHITRLIWPLKTISCPSNPIDYMDCYEGMNRDIVAFRSTVDSYLNILQNRIPTLFIHFILAPAFIQLRNILYIEERYIGKMLQMLLSFIEDLSDAYFLVDCFPVNIKLVCAIIYILKTNEMRCFESYQLLCDILCPTQSTVTTDIWRKRFEKLWQTFRYQPNAESYMKEVRSIRCSSIDDISEDVALIAVLIATCYIKCPTFTPFVNAFIDAATLVNETYECDRNLPMPRKMHPAYENGVIETSLQEFRKNLARARFILMGKKELSDEDSLLFDCMVSLCMAPYFSPDSTNELLNMLATIFVNYNEQKKIIVFYGEQNTGKSYFCDILQHIYMKCCGRFRNLSEAMRRSCVSSKYLILLLNEMKRIDDSELKSITGNDGESTAIFYSQNYELKLNQSLIFAATNNHPIVGNDEMDPVAARRFHAMRLTGEQVQSTKKFVSLFEMMASNKLYIKTIEENSPAIISKGMIWLAYAAYMTRRDNDFTPYLNEECDSVKEYINMTYYLNNSLYRILINCGIQIAEGFHISTKTFLATIKTYLDLNKDSPNVKVPTKLSDMSKFAMEFRRQYGIDLNVMTTVPNFQMTNFINHVEYNMDTVECYGQNISSIQLETKIREIYISTIDCENARSYFCRMNEKKYNAQFGIYENLSFRHESDCSDKYDYRVSHDSDANSSEMYDVSNVGLASRKF